MLNPQEESSVALGAVEPIESRNGHPLFRSLSGLQAKLQSYDTHDINDADLKLKNLADRFEQLQIRLANFIKLRETIQAAAHAVDNIHYLSFDLDHQEITERLGKQIRLIVDAAKVIRFRRAIRER